ncbi:hypothetical protein [Kribbella sp. C-35]
MVAGVGKRGDPSIPVIAAAYTPARPLADATAPAPGSSIASRSGSFQP